MTNYERALDEAIEVEREATEVHKLRSLLADAERQRDAYQVALAKRIQGHDGFMSDPLRTFMQRAAIEAGLDG